MKHFTNQSYESHVGRMNYGGAKFCRFALFPLMLLMLLLLPTRMVAQTDYDTSVTLSALAGNPEGYDNETYANLFDGNNTKWCCAFDSKKGAYVIFEASKAGVPVGYTITTGNDNANWGCKGRNPLSWKLYGNNEGKEGAWTLIQEVENDTKLQDKNFTSYDFPCEGSTSYKYFKWEISAIHSGSTLQVGEFELKFQTCSHKNANGSDALGAVIKNVDPTCVEHGYTTKECSICHSIVKVYKDDELKPHTLTRHAQKNATCTEAGNNIEYWQCSVCNKLFSDANATTEITDAASLEIPAKGHQYNSEGVCTVCGSKGPRYDLFNGLEGITDVTITDNGSYPWQMLDLNADGMSNVSSYFTKGSTGLMSSNYHVNNSKSEISVTFNVEKPILFSFKYLISADSFNYVIITLNGKQLDCIYGTDQKVNKSILNKGKYTLNLSYYTSLIGYEGADRAFIYDLKTETFNPDYVAEYDSTNTTLTFKKNTSDNQENLDLSRIAMVNNECTVKDMCVSLGIETTAIKNIVFDESFKTYAPTSLNNFFKDSKALETISGFEYLNTANVANMSYMFYGCSALKSLDLTNFNTENVTDMKSMFDGCSALTSLNLTNFNTAKVTDMRYMFYGCSSLTSLDLTKVNTAKVTSMYQMFYGCSALKSLDLTNFNTANVTSMYQMFYGCSALTSLDLTNFNTAKVWDMSGMFNGCSSLTSLDLTNFNTAKVKYMYNMFNGCSALTTIYASDKFVTTKVEDGSEMFTGCKNLKDYNDSNIDHKYANCSTTGYFTSGCGYAEFDNATGTLTFSYKGLKPEGAYDLNVGTTEPGWRTHKTEVKKVVFAASFANARPTSCYDWFYMCQNLTNIEGIENLNTEKVTNMSYMFYKCSALKSLDLTNFNTENVTNMSSMFSGCSSFTSLDLTNFNTEKVTDMEYMFNGCSALESLDLTNFNTANVLYMGYMFYGCSALTTIYASDKFVTSNVDYGSEMFTGCQKLKGYSASKTDHRYANCSTTGYFTSGCGYAEFDNATGTLTFRYKGVKPEGVYALNEGATEPGWRTHKTEVKKVVFDASFANARPTSCYYWFNECENLTNIEGIEYLNTENVTDMNSMFSGCSVLKSLDLTNFNTANVTDMRFMFSGCSALTTIYASDKFVTTKVEYGSEMFTGCKNLKGYNDSNIDHKYANCSPTGYFTSGGCGYAEFDNATGTLTFSYKGVKPEGAYNLNVGENIPEWNTLGTNVKKVVFDASFANARPTSCYKWFYDYNKLATIEGIENLNTENVTNMYSMFDGCSALTSLNLTNFNTANVKDMGCMFSRCSALTPLNVTNFNTANLTNMRGMFYHCSALTSLDLTNFNTANVTDMNSMFDGCSVLTTIYASDKFVTDNVETGVYMFTGCQKLKGFIDYINNTDKTDHKFANYKTGYFSKLVGKNGYEKIGAVGEKLTAERLTLKDEKDFVAYEPFTAKAASYSRFMNTNTTWATLCLPFEVSLADQNFRAFELLSANEATNTVELKEIETSIAAGTPVIIKMNKSPFYLEIDIYEANKDIVQKVVSAANGSYQLQGLYTKKVFDKEADNNCYIVKGNKLMNPAKLLENINVTKVASKPFRAYMVDKSSSAAGAKMFSIGFDDSTTAIDSLNTIANDKAEYYDLQGKRLNEPQKGINIVKRNGKTMKVIIK